MKSNPVTQPATIIAVFGSSRFEKGSTEYQQAYELGYVLAKAGYSIINGGGPGSMEATASGAGACGGMTIGAIVRGVDWQKPNTFIQQVIECDDLFLRIHEIYTRAAAFLILKGGTGTLAELAIVWNLLSLETPPTKPLILVGDAWRAVITGIQNNMLITPAEERVIHIARSTEEVISLLKQYA